MQKNILRYLTVSDAMKSQNGYDIHTNAISAKMLLYFTLYKALHDIQVLQNQLASSRLQVGIFVH